jgi:hypothetical protein
MLTATQQEQGIEWKVGDKAFFEHQEVTIHDVEPDGRVHGVSDGSFITGSFRLNERLFPVTDGGRKIVNFFHSQYEALHKMPGNRLFNWPDLSHAIDGKFTETMRKYHAGDEAGVLNRVCSYPREEHTCEHQVAEATTIVVDGVRVFENR